MKRVMQGIILLLFLFVGVPLVVGLSLSDNENRYTADYYENKVETPEKIKVWNVEKEKVEKVDFEDYICQVVACEMPAGFENEALKAQAVAVRTYAMSKVLSFYDTEPEEHPKAPVCNSTHCQVYKSMSELVESHGEGWRDEGFEKIRKACSETEGELLYYEGKLVTQPLFFSSSGGQTENSEDVFSDEYPYLVSVSSTYEEGASHSNEVKTFSIEEFQRLINEKYADRNSGEKIATSDIKIISRTAGGRVDKMQIGSSTYKGTEVRSALGLSSALFSIGFKEENGESYIVFTTNGYGHGVGMSQYGANGMAKRGSDYKEILGHYYTGTKVY